MGKYEYLGPPMAAVIGGKEVPMQTGALLDLAPRSPFTMRLLARRMIRIVVPEPPMEPEMVWTPEGAAVEAPKCGCGHGHLGRGDRTGHHEPDITVPDQPEPEPETGTVPDQPEQGPETETETKPKGRQQRRNRQ